MHPLLQECTISIAYAGEKLVLLLPPMLGNKHRDVLDLKAFQNGYWWGQGRVWRGSDNYESKKLKISNESYIENHLYEEGAHVKKRNLLKQTWLTESTLGHSVNLLFKQQDWVQEYSQGTIQIMSQLF